MPTLRQGNYFKIKGVCKYGDVSPLHPCLQMLIFFCHCPKLENIPTQISKCSTSNQWKQDPGRGTLS